MQTIVYTSNMERAATWYTTVLDAEPASRSAVWTSFPVGDGVLALHHVDAPPEGARVELSLVATEPLEAIVARLSDAGVTVERGIREEPFGRSILLRDPDGSPLQINEHG